MLFEDHLCCVRPIFQLPCSIKATWSFEKAGFTVFIKRLVSLLNVMGWFPSIFVVTFPMWWGNLKSWYINLMAFFSLGGAGMKSLFCCVRCVWSSPCSFSGGNSVYFYSFSVSVDLCLWTCQQRKNISSAIDWCSEVRVPSGSSCGVRVCRLPSQERKIILSRNLIFLFVMVFCWCVIIKLISGLNVSISVTSFKASYRRSIWTSECFLWGINMGGRPVWA